MTYAYQWRSFIYWTCDECGATGEGSTVEHTARCGTESFTLSKDRP